MPDPTMPKIDEYGYKVTQTGYAWEERTMDGEYVAALRGSEDEYDPSDYFDDEEYYPDEDEED